MCVMDLSKVNHWPYSNQSKNCSN